MGLRLIFIENGIIKLTFKPKQIPVDRYFELQRRYSHLTKEEIKEIQETIDAKKERMLDVDGKNIWIY